MTNERANEIFRTKYPEGRIFMRGKFGGTGSGALAVEFRDGGKVYDYQGQSYAEVLRRFGFNVIYKHDVVNIEKRIADLEYEIEHKKSKYSLFVVEYSDETISQKKEQLKEYRECLKTAIVES